MTIFPLMLIRTAGLPLRWVDSLAADWTEEIADETDWAMQTRQAFDAALMALAASPLRTAIYNARRDFFNRGKLPNANFKELLAERRDLPEIAQLIESLHLLEKNREAQKAFSERHEHALRANWQILQRTASDENLRRALLFASHDLLNRLPAFCEKPVEQFAKKDRQTALSLLQYLTRAAVKTSPLSRFTTVAVWQPFPVATPPPAPTPPKGGRGVRDADSTSPLPFRGGVGGGVEKGTEETILSTPKSIVTPNVALLPAIYEILLREPAFYRALALSLNPCITERGERLWLYFDGERESFQEMQTHPVADFVVKMLLENKRRLPFPELLDSLEEEVDAVPEQLQNLVFELIDIGLLEWELPEKGLSPGWCGALYNFLGFLKEQPPVVVDAATLLQWLRTAARTLPFQSVENAQETQREAVRMAQDFYEKNSGAMPPIPAEQIFFEDVEESAEVEVSGEAVQVLAEDLAACWQARDVRRVPAAHARLFSFTEKTIPPGQALDFLGFGKIFLENEKANVEVGNAAMATSRANEKPEKIGALLQIFKDKNGEFRAVVNGLFPGGGKLFARWLHLFSPEVLAQLKTWFTSETNTAPFPWQGWSNANFQPPISKTNLAVPDGRTWHLQGGKQILLGNLSVKHGVEGLQLIDNENNEPVLLTDLGLESPELRPPAMQVLWRLGVPYVSIDMLLSERKWAPGGDGWQLLERVEYGSLVLARKSWQIDQAVTAQWLSERSDAGFFRRVRKDFLAMRAPRRFFVRLPQQKPQYFDLDSPLCMQLFAKTLRQAKTPVVLTEMLPLPEQCVVWKDGLRAAEFVMEFEV